VKLSKVENSDHYMFYCPGCEHHHVYDSRWTFNGNFEKPTFSPSLLNTWTSPRTQTKKICHLFLTDGKLQYCGDCTHPLAGKTIDLPDLEGIEE
jgi:hypothetical protein